MLKAIMKYPSRRLVFSLLTSALVSLTLFLIATLFLIEKAKIGSVISFSQMLYLSLAISIISILSFITHGALLIPIVQEFPKRKDMDKNFSPMEILNQTIQENINQFVG